jgi:hypothetical protein
MSTIVRQADHAIKIRYLSIYKINFIIVALLVFEINTIKVFQLTNFNRTLKQVKNGNNRKLLLLVFLNNIDKSCVFRVKGNGLLRILKVNLPNNKKILRHYKSLYVFDQILKEKKYIFFQI